MTLGLVLTAFGTSYQEAYEKNIRPIFDGIKDEIGNENVEIVEAFTSRIIINKWKKRDGIIFMNEREAVQHLKGKGIKDIRIQPLHILKGHEYEKLVKTGCPVGRPLLENQKDIREFDEKIPFQVESSQALILMGHGSDHEVDRIYQDLQEYYWEKGQDNIYVGTVEGARTLDHLLVELDKKPYRDVILRPLMIVAGDHAQNDMAGEEKDSWKSILQDKGYHVICILQGLGQEKQVQKLYLERTNELIRRKI